MRMSATTSSKLEKVEITVATCEHLSKMTDDHFKSSFKDGGQTGVEFHRPSFFHHISNN